MGSGIESDEDFPFYVIGFMLPDKGNGDIEAVLGDNCDGGISSHTSFRQWFMDAPGLNLSEAWDFEMTHLGDGVYEYEQRDDERYSMIGGLFPIDGRMLGNSSGTPDHNYHYTVEFNGTFTYDASADQFIEFEGEDDVWIFINRKLVIDLGGVHGSASQYFDLERMCLTDGEEYEVHFFFAERHRTTSEFRLRTNLLIGTTRGSAMTAAYD